MKTDSMQSIGMKALGECHHVSFGDKVLICDVMRGSRCKQVELGKRQRSICRRVALLEETEYATLWIFENRFHGLYWNERVGYIALRFIW